MGKVKDLLPTGRDNAVAVCDLAEKMRITERKLREIITEERTAGTVICSSVSGYYLPANRAEIEDFCHFMEKRAKHSFVAIQSARRALGVPEGQQELSSTSR